MKVDNSEKVRSMLLFEEPGDFYVVEIIKRRKDNLEMARGEDNIRDYYIDSLEEYDRLLPRIKRMCECEKARGYIRVNKRNYNKIGLKLIKRIADYVDSNQSFAIKNAFKSVVSEEHSDPDKKWIVDIDWVDFEPEHEIHNEILSGTSKVAELISFVIHLQHLSGREPLSEMLPTKNGMHLITRPFNLEHFKKEYPNVAIHRDNLTMIYCP